MIFKEVRNMYFAYGKTEVSYLRRKDKRLCAVIDRIGHIDRAIDTDLFSSVIHHIIGQQISTKAQATIWQRMQDALVKVNAETILAAGIPKLQALGQSLQHLALVDIAKLLQSLADAQVVVLFLVGKGGVQLVGRDIAELDQNVAEADVFHGCTPPLSQRITFRDTLNAVAVTALPSVSAKLRSMALSLIFKLKMYLVRKIHL